MKFSETWLREWVNPDISTEELIEQLTLLGLEVDDHGPAGGQFDKVVVARIEELSQHPDADRLRVCKVNDGTGELRQIVCGAPNAAVGLVAPLARVGAELPGGLKIKTSKLRGVESDGMLCSAAELQLSESADGLYELPADAPIGESISDYLQLADELIEIDLTPNRGDCLSLRGVAREISARNNVDLHEPETPDVQPGHTDTFPLEVAADSCCAQFAGRVIRGADASVASPHWMVEKLRRSGVRSISPAVDVTNYVMLSLGQPMHAFDLATLSGGIRVRCAEKGEKVVLLDGRELELDADTTVIADHAKVVAIAGIMGGDATGVSDQTTDILLEAALFMPIGIAGKPRRYNAYTDAAQRFERGVDSDLQVRAIQYATRLLVDIVGGVPGPVFETRNPSLQRTLPEVRLEREVLTRRLGTEVSDQRVIDILQRLGLEVKADAEGWSAMSPSWRYDIVIEEDLIEEVARVHGYNNIPRSNPRWVAPMQPVSESRQPHYATHQLLIGRGYQEAVCYSFVDQRWQSAMRPDEPALELANPISSDMAVMRNTLWVGLCQALRNNQNRQQADVRLFESGLCFRLEQDELLQTPVLAGLVAGNLQAEHWTGESRRADFYDVKADVEALLEHTGNEWSFQAAVHPTLHPGRSAQIKVAGQCCGWLGEMHPKLQKILDLSQLPVLFEIDRQVLQQASVPLYQEISRFPSVRRDLAIIVDDHVTSAQISDAVRAHAPTLLHEIRVFDVYSGKGVTNGRKSVALGLILQDISSTLEDADIEDATSRILQGLATDLQATLRT